MSGAPAKAGVTVNGIRVGETALPGGYAWRTCSFFLPAAAIPAATYQEVQLSASEAQDGNYLAIDYLETQDSGGRYQIQLGLPDAGCADVAGWRWAEGGPDRAWRWATADRAGAGVWLDVSRAEEVRITAMSEVENVLRLSLDGVAAGESRLPGGFQWTELRFPLTTQSLSGYGLHKLQVQSSGEKNGLFFAAQTIEFVMKRVP
jgi:hypothetical protein